MRKFKILAVLLVTLLIFASVFALASCNPTSSDDTNNNDNDIKKDVIANELIEFAYVKNANGTYVITGLKNEDATKLKLPEKVVKIHSDAFKDNDKLEYVKFSSTITEIGASAFANCENIETFEFPGSCSVWQEITKGTDWDSGIASYTIYCVDGTIDEEGNVTLGTPDDGEDENEPTPDNPDTPDTPEEPDTPDNPDTPDGEIVADSLEDFQYGVTDEATSDAIKDCFTDCPYDTFYVITGLVLENATKIVFPENVYGVDSQAFYDNDNISSLTLSKYLMILESDCFEGCDNLLTFIYPDTHSKLEDIRDFGEVIGYPLEAAFSSLGDFVIYCTDGTYDSEFNFTKYVCEECADNDGDHKCDVCQDVLSECLDENSDHLCDKCENILSDCADNDNDHDCDLCGEDVSECLDEDNDHLCDKCESVLSDCADNDKDHNCDICGETLSTCVNDDNDDYCDICNQYNGILILTLNSDDTYTVSGCKEEQENIIILPTYNNKTVTSIVSDAFYNCTSLTSVVIPNSVTSIGDDAFYYCTSLTSVYYTGTIDQWVQIEFSGYTANPLYYAKNLYINNELVTEANITTATSIMAYAFFSYDSLTSVTIPNSVTSIGDYAFSGCASLSSVNISSIESWCGITFDGTSANPLYNGAKLYLNGEEVTNLVIPDTITEIKSYAFYGCASLSSVTIGNSVESIEVSAFSECVSLESITIPASVNYIAETNIWDDKCSSFFGCYSLKEIIVDEENTYYKTIDGNLYSKDGTVLYQYAIAKEEKSFQIPNGVESVAAGAFFNAVCLEEVIIPNTITFIGDVAFYDCFSLTSIIIGESVEFIGVGAFWDCYRLVEVYNLSSLYITIGSEEENGGVGYNALDVYTALDSPSKLSTDSNGYIIHTNGEEKILVGYTGSETELTIPNGITAIYKNTFSFNDAITSVAIPDTVESIGEMAFNYCTSLVSVTIGSSVDSIGERAFAECKSLTSVNYLGTIDQWVQIEFSDSSANPLSNGAKLYLNGEEVTNLVMPDMVTEIKAYAFYGCTSLTSVTILNSITSIGECAFYNCPIEYANIPTTAIDSISLSKLKEIVINGGENIRDEAFYRCSYLTRITISDAVMNIGENLFIYCPLEYANIPTNAIDNIDSNTRCNLKELVINSGENISDYAFYRCSYLTSVTIGNSVTSIGYEAFAGCVSLTSVYYTGTIDQWVQIEFSDYTANPLSYAKNLYINNELVTEANLTTATSIKAYAFSGYDSLTSVTIGNSVTSIGYEAFAGCVSLTSVTIGNSVTSIGDYAFEYCTSLTSVTIGNSVTSIGSDAFRNCRSLTSVTIGDSVTSIGDYAFYNCPIEYASIPTMAIYYIWNNSKLKEVVITSGDSIGRGAFSECSSLTSVTIGNSVTSIGDYAFEYCESLTSVYYTGTIDQWVQIEFSGYTANPLYYAKNLYINNELVTEANITTATSIKAYAFYSYDSLTSVTVGNSVTSIGDYAFSGCDSLTSVTIGNSVTSIGDDAFYKCYKLVEVYNLSSLNIQKGSEDYGYVGYYAKDIYTSLNTPSKLSTDEKGYIIYTDGQTKSLVGYVGDETELTLPSGITEIYQYAFYKSDFLTSVVIPDSVTSIGDYAFYVCRSLTSVTIGNSVTNIGDYAFYDCYKLVEVYNLSSLDITAGNSSYGYVGRYAKDIYTSLNTPSKLSTDEKGYIIYTDGQTKSLVGYVGEETELTLPSGITEIYQYAFYYCTSLTSVVIPDSVTSIGNYAFRYCRSLTSVTIGNSVTNIGNYAFEYCTSLTSVVIPDSVINIGDYAFYVCDSLTNVTIGNSVTSIGNYAFSNCASLTSVVIPDSVTSIGNYAFRYCRSLTVINYVGTKAEWDNITKGSYWNSGTGNYTIYYDYEIE